MTRERLEFDAMEWRVGSHPLERKKFGALGGATLLRFEPGFEDRSWCVAGHAGYVVDGVLRLAFDDGAEEYAAGQGFVIDPGTRHRASNPGAAPVTLFIASR